MDAKSEVHSLANPMQTRKAPPEINPPDRTRLILQTVNAIETTTNTSSEAMNLYIACANILWKTLHAGRPTGESGHFDSGARKKHRERKANIRLRRGQAWRTRAQTKDPIRKGDATKRYDGIHLSTAGAMVLAFFFWRE
jgi:hypothetical protein